MAILSRKFPLLRTAQYRISFPSSHFINTSAPSHKRKETDATLVSSIVDSLNKGLNWKTLSQNFSSFMFTNSLVQTILLQLKEPINSRKALNFFHWSAKDMHLQHGILSYCLIIHILAKARLTRDAKALLESVLSKNNSEGGNQILSVLDSLIGSYGIVESVPLVFDLFIQTCAKLRMFDSVLDACKLLSESRFSLKVTSFNALLHVVQKSDRTHLVWDVYEHMVDKGVCPNEMTVRIMVSALSKDGKLATFVDIVDRMNGKRSPQLIVNTCLVYEMIKQERTEDGLVLLKHLFQKNMISDSVSYSLFVFAKVKLRNLDGAADIHEEMIKRGFEYNAFVCHLFVGAYCQEGKIEEAIKMLLEIETLGFKPWDETLNQLIIGCSNSGRLEDSLAFCKKTVEMGLLPSISAINVMLEKLCQNAKVRQGDEMLTILLDKGFVPDEETYSPLIAGYGKDGDIDQVMKVIFEMEYRSIFPNMSGFTSLIATCCKFRKFEAANKYLEMMKARSLTPSSNVYEILIAGYLNEGNKNRAHQLHLEMVGANLTIYDNQYGIEV